MTDETPTLAGQIAEQIRFVDTFRKRTGTTSPFVEEAREALLAAGFVLGLGETALVAMRQAAYGTENGSGQLAIEGADDDDQDDEPPRAAARPRRRTT